MKDYKKILFDYILENEDYTDFPSLNIAEEKLVNSLSEYQRKLFDIYYEENAKYFSNRNYYYFCKGIRIRL